MASGLLDDEGEKVVFVANSYIQVITHSWFDPITGQVGPPVSRNYVTLCNTPPLDLKLVSIPPLEVQCAAERLQYKAGLRMIQIPPMPTARLMMEEDVPGLAAALAARAEGEPPSEAVLFDAPGPATASASSCFHKEEAQHLQHVSWRAPSPPQVVRVLGPATPAVVQLAPTGLESGPGESEPKSADPQPEQEGEGTEVGLSLPPGDGYSHADASSREPCSREELESIGESESFVGGGWLQMGPPESTDQLLVGGPNFQSLRDQEESMEVGTGSAQIADPVTSTTSQKGSPGQGAALVKDTPSPGKKASPKGGADGKKTPPKEATTPKRQTTPKRASPRHSPRAPTQ
jgi:hypothetical protein